jgi:hypothetical protein
MRRTSPAQVEEEIVSYEQMTLVRSSPIGPKLKPPDSIIVEFALVRLRAKTTECTANPARNVLPQKEKRHLAPNHRYTVKGSLG